MQYVILGLKHSRYSRRGRVYAPSPARFQSGHAHRQKCLGENIRSWNVVHPNEILEIALHTYYYCILFLRSIRRSAMPRLHVYSIYSTECSGTHHGVARKCFACALLSAPCAMLSCIVFMFFDSSFWHIIVLCIVGFGIGLECLGQRLRLRLCLASDAFYSVLAWCCLGRRCKCWPHCILVRTHNAMRTRTLHTHTNTQREGERDRELE